jgi:hypothetical protein
MARAGAVALLGEDDSQLLVEAARELHVPATQHQEV